MCCHCFPTQHHLQQPQQLLAAVLPLAAAAMHSWQQHVTRQQQTQMLKAFGIALAQLVAAAAA
jgi:hypothetical protein